MIIVGLLAVALSCLIVGLVLPSTPWLIASLIATAGAGYVLFRARAVLAGGAHAIANVEAETNVLGEPVPAADAQDAAVVAPRTPRRSRRRADTETAEAETAEAETAVADETTSAVEEPAPRTPRRSRRKAAVAESDESGAPEIADAQAAVEEPAARSPRRSRRRAAAEVAEETPAAEVAPEAVTQVMPEIASDDAADAATAVLPLDEIAESTEAAEPTEPTEPTETAEQIEPVEPAEPAAPVAEANPGDVWVIDGRPRYHLETCAIIQGQDAEPIPIEQATEDGFMPCSLCEPNIVRTA